MINIHITSKPKLLALVLNVGVALAPLHAIADDIDIFIGSSGGAAAAPNVMILLDNSDNWSRASQHWPDAPTQGDAELRAISSVLNSITTPVNLGLAMLTSSTPNGGYVRFGSRDVTIAANKTALQNIVGGIVVTSPSEKLSGMSSKEETAGIYELYKYFNSLAPYAGAPANNPNADVAGNTNPLTGAGQGLTSGFAFKADGTYNGPSTASCGKNYIIYIANNANNTGAAGQQTYEPPSGANAGPALAPTALDTWTDEWTKFLLSNNQITTFVLDAFNAQQNAAYSASLQNAAKVGGGSYTQVSSQAAIQSALLQIFANIQAVNTTFASASLPVNATNRAQNQNQVFIGMFRPDPNAKPRWFGNMKQYQLINNVGSIDLGDASGTPAINPATGFLTSCATSFWTTDSGAYWGSVSPISPSPAGTCLTTTFNKFSDAPDGSFVEKGAVGEVIRNGNNPPTTNTTPTNAVNRTVYTLSGSALVAFDKTSSGLPVSVVDFTTGHDVNAEVTSRTAPSTLTRPSLHGDVIHSRPLPLNYGGTTGVVVYYGANDGTLRAVNGANGNELWAFVAPESFSSLTRLMTQSPLVNYPNLPAGTTPTPAPKDYFFDGSTGAFQNASNSQVWIYPSMRRGGRVIYALDVTTPTSPSFKWKVGCPNLTNDTGCSAGMTGIGQTWSLPNVAFIKGYSTTVPVIAVGGGYDACEDQNTATPTCTSPKGAAVYILNGNDGTVLASFPTTRSVIADVALIDIDNDGDVDYAYAVDTGGNVYRIDFIDGPTTRVSLASAAWTMHRVAYTNGAGRKFEFAPALLLNGQKVYVAVGSGDREHPLSTQYPFTSVVNRFYVYLDDLTPNLAATNLDDVSVMLDNTTLTSCSSTLLTPGSTWKGWFMTLNQNGQGEQTVTSAVISAGMATFSTNRPIPAAAGTCATTLGEARGYLVNLLNGSGAIGVAGSCGGYRSGIFVGGGLPPSPVLGTIPVGGVPKTVVIGAIQKSGASSSPIGAQQVRPPISSTRKRIYWYMPGLDN
jgi:type IV pilus assembly protein PilY1